ncbi:MAG: hypothetical protein AAF495_22100 [Pseudomonadota bacterium]
MTLSKADLEDLLLAKIELWAAKPFDRLVEELVDVVAYEQGSGTRAQQFEVQILERDADFLHICLSVDDGSFLRSFAPPTRSIIVHRDGRIER